MKNQETANNDENREQSETANNTATTQPDAKKPKSKKRKLSGAYYYLDMPDEAIQKRSLIRSLLIIVAILIQLIVLAFLPQGGLKYVNDNISSYAYVYVWTVFVMLGVSIYVVIMNIVRYKIAKRLPKEYAPKKGFRRHVFLSTEILMAVYALILAMEISFACFFFDVMGLVAILLCALSLGAVVGARQVTQMTLSKAVLIGDEQQTQTTENEQKPNENQTDTDKTESN